VSEARFKVTYSPEGAAPKVWEIDIVDGLKASEMIALKRVSGGAISGVSPLMVGLSELDGEAVKGLLWLLLKREMSTVPWDGLDFNFGEVVIDEIDDSTPGQILARLQNLDRQGNLNEIGRTRMAELVAAGVTAEREDDDPKA
jgi:hypothetical protein